MDIDFFTTYSAYIAVVSSVVAIISVTLCSVLTAIITQRGTRKAKKSELIFHEMVTAYYDFLRAFDEFSDYDDLEQLTRCGNASARALLFASDNTKRLIAEYGMQATQCLRAKKTGGPVLELAEISGTTRGKLIEAMQVDLRK